MQIKKLIPPFASVFLFFIGNGLVFTLLVVTLNHIKAPISIIGGMTSAYFAGLALGSFQLGRLIHKVGHIRAFASFAAGIIAIFILHGLLVFPYFWLLLRFISGFLIGGILLVIESWLISSSRVGNRGQVLAFYMIILYTGFALGQFFLEYFNMETLGLFSVAAIACALSIIPLASSEVQQPRLIKPKILSWSTLFAMTKIGLVGAFTSGLILSNVFGMLPYYFLKTPEVKINEVGIFVAVLILGGVILQYPIGKLSDRFNRPVLLGIICIFIIIFSFIIMFLFSNRWIAFSSIFIFGGLVFALYPVSISHACDRLDDEYILPGSQTLLLLYSTGAMIGPLVTPSFIKLAGINGLFIFFIAASFALAFFIGALHIANKRKIRAPEEPHVALPAGTTPIISKMDPRT